MSFKEYAEVVAHRLCVYIHVAENALKTLDDDPRKAFVKLAGMGEDEALCYILSTVEV